VVRYAARPPHEWGSKRGQVTDGDGKNHNLSCIEHIENFSDFAVPICPLSLVGWSRGRRELAQAQRDTGISRVRDGVCLYYRIQDNGNNRRNIVAGRPILRAYLDRVEGAGVQNILNRLAGGESIAAIARSIGTSRPFLSTFLNSTPEGVEALALAREIAAANGPKSKGSGTRSGMYGWAKDAARPQLAGWLASVSLSHTGPQGAERAQANHLDALKQLRAERTGPQPSVSPAPQHQLTTAPQDPATPQAPALPRYAPTD
jgi:hypothetical protein